MQFVPSIRKLGKFFFDEDAALGYLQNEGILPKEKDCEACGGPTVLIKAKLMFRCRKKSCRKGFSLRKGTFFANQCLPLGKTLHLAHMWLLRSPVASIISQCEVGSATVASYLVYLRQLVSDALDEEDCVIGGEGIVVEIDETKMGKRKHNRGHRVEGVWVVGGVEITEDRRVFAVPVEKRDAETLLNVIKTHVRPGSIIHTDMWKGY
uniref:DDE_Tnp_IS1595 domain-containing protein n=1 Tax=Strongyloides papillosus TaxID=174720 RepID=A0A0N5BHB7_STREA